MSDTEIASGDMLFEKEPYAPPEPGCMYSVRDKRKGERIVRVVDVSEDHREVQVQVLKDGHAATEPIPVAVDALNRKAEKGWCSRLKPVDSHEEAPDAESQPAAPNPTSTAEMRLNTQHFHRCCGEIVRANIQFDTHVIREIGDGAFRAGNYEQAFQKFEQISTMFTTAVSNSRRAIADGRRDLAAAKLKLSGREIQERTAGYARNEQLINTAEREFSMILESLRLCVQAQQVNTNASPSTSPTSEKSEMTIKANPRPEKAMLEELAEEALLENAAEHDAAPMELEKQSDTSNIPDSSPQPTAGKTCETESKKDAATAAKEALERISSETTRRAKK